MSACAGFTLRDARPCRYRGRANWSVVGDLHGRAFCWVHAIVVGRAPGASGLMHAAGSTALFNVDPDNQFQPVGADALIAGYEQVTCVQGYQRVRDAWFHPPAGAPQVPFGNPQVTGAERDARARVRKITGATEGGLAMNLSDTALAVTAAVCMLGSALGVGVWWERNRTGGTRDLRGRLARARREVTARRAAAMTGHPSASPVPPQRALTPPFPARRPSPMHVVPGGKA